MIENLIPLPEVEANIQRTLEADIESTVRYMRKHAAERMREIETTRQALALLDGAGIDVDAWGYGQSARISLGFFKLTKAGNQALAARVRAIREALGCRIEQHGKDVEVVEDKTATGRPVQRKRITFTMRPVLFPGVRITFSRPLKDGPGVRCRVVRTVEVRHSLVCDS